MLLQPKRPEKEEEEDEEVDSQDSAYDNYFGRIAEGRGKDREELDFDEKELFEDDEEEDQLFMNDDDYERDLEPAVIKGGKTRPSYLLSVSTVNC